MKLPHIRIQRSLEGDGWVGHDLHAGARTFFPDEGGAYALDGDGRLAGQLVGTRDFHPGRRPTVARNRIRRFMLEKE